MEPVGALYVGLATFWTMHLLKTLATAAPSPYQGYRRPLESVPKTNVFAVWVDLWKHSNVAKVLTSVLLAAGFSLLVGAETIAQGTLVAVGGCGIAVVVHNVVRTLARVGDEASQRFILRTAQQQKGG